MSGPWEDEFLWADGNYACDCNRASFFAWAGGEKEPRGVPCGMSTYVIDATKGRWCIVSWIEDPEDMIYWVPDRPGPKSAEALELHGHICWGLGWEPGEIAEAGMIHNEDCLHCRLETEKGVV